MKNLSKKTKTRTLSSRIVFFFMILVLPCSSLFSQSKIIELNMSDPKLWTVDQAHLGSNLIKIGYNAKESAAVLQPLWSVSDKSSTDVAVSNVNNGRLHTYQHIKMSDCTQAEIEFEINIPKEYIDEGKMEFVFSLQAGKEGDYLFNAHTYKMSDFVGSGGTYKKMIVVPSDLTDKPVKLRKIERFNIIFERKGSIVSAPIKIRNAKINLHEDKIIPPAEDTKIVNPQSYYKFTYNTQKAVDSLNVWVSTESMDITRKLNNTGDGMLFIPQWAAGQIPSGHTGNVSINQPLGAKHNFEPFKVEYVFTLPQSYIDEEKIQIVLFVQAGEEGFYVWSGVPRDMSYFKGKAGQDVVLTLSSEDFIVNKQKSKNQIETVGLKFDRHGSTLTEPITLKSITVKLDGK